MSKLAMFKPGIVLLIVAAIASLVLSGVNAATEGRIEKLADEKMTAAMQTVLPAAAYSDTGWQDDGEVNAVYAASTGGWVVQATESGSQGLITLMVGVSSQFTCTGVSVTESSETAGLGAIASQASEKGDAFRAQFIGVSGEVRVTKEGGAIDAIAGATITSKAVSRAVTAALAACQSLAAPPVAAGPASMEPASSVPTAQTASAEPASAESPAQTASAEPAPASAG